MLSLINYWWVYLIIHVFCCALGYGIFHNVDTGLIAMDRLMLLMGLLGFVAILMQISLWLCWQLIKSPYWLGLYIRDKINFQLRNY